jgi:hypothetical protein
MFTLNYVIKIDQLFKNIGLKFVCVFRVNIKNIYILYFCTIL